MMRRKRVGKAICLFIRVLVFISIASTLALRETHPEVRWQMYNRVLLCYMCTLVFERSGNLLIQLIVGIVKIYIIFALMSLIVIYRSDMPLAVCNFIICVGYITEQIMRFCHWSEDKQSEQ